MIIWNTFVLALKAIARNRMRSLLTALGVVIGVASVIAMVHLGQAATFSVTSQISSMGSSLLYVRPGSSVRGPGGIGMVADPFTSDDVEAIAQSVDGVIVAPGVVAGATLVFGNANYTTTVTGTTNEFFAVREWEVADGRTFEERELSRGAAVCVVGQTVVDELFQGEPPVGESMRVGSTTCAVVGLLREKGESFGMDQDDVVLMPIKTVQRRIVGSPDVSLIYASVVRSKPSARAKVEIESLMRERRRIGSGDADDFNVMDMQEIAATLAATTSVLTSLLGAIAAVSLLVGGIGIMNIMMVSVTERTREIGIRLAIGARSREVLMQFLVESVAVSALGGVLGVVVGVAGSWFAIRALGMTFVLSPNVVVLAFAFSMAIGVVFGFVPARKAARLDPIQALRHE